MAIASSAADIRHHVKRVAFTCDFLRFSVVQEEYACGQLNNLAWLIEILTGASAWAENGIEFMPVVPPTEKHLFESDVGQSVLEEYRQDPYGAWARRYDVEQLDAFERLLEKLCKFDLVIGFELPPTIRRHLHQNHRPYLNLYIHPLRFLRDLCLGATTNASWIHDCLQAQQVSPSEISVQVRRFRALCLKQKSIACAIPAGLPVLIGQTERDSVLIQHGKFFGWDSNADALNEQLAAFDTVVFLEHPERANSDSVTEYLRSVHGKTVVATNANSYGVLFGNPEIPLTLTLASSLGVEAQAIGLNAKFLLSDPRNKFILKDIDQPTHGAYGHGVLEPEFWQQIFQGNQQESDVHKANSRGDFPLGENFLRNSLGAWSYRALNKGLAGITSRKVLLPSAELTSERRAILLGSLVGRTTPLDPRDAFAGAKIAGLQLDLLDPPLALGERREVALNSRSAARYLAHGFHPLESWGGWSSGLKSQILIPLTPETLSHEAWLEVTMVIRCFEGLVPRAPVLRISSDDHLIGFVFFRPSGFNRQTITFSLMPRSPRLAIDLEFTDIESPAARGYGEDTRSLGFALSELTISSHRDFSADMPNSDTFSLTLWGIDATPISVPISK